MVPAVLAVAQEKPAVTPENPLSTWNKAAYTRVKGLLARSAEKMPEENYSFKPVDTVRSYGQITDASAVQTIKLFGNDALRLSALTVNNMHNLEHYGNLSTYMRMKNIVPPSSEQPPTPPQPTKK